MSLAVLEKAPPVKPFPPRQHARTVMLFLIVFGAGGLTGAGVATLHWQGKEKETPATRGPTFSRLSDGFLNHMRDEYELSEPQAEQLSAIIKQNHERIDQINKEFRPKFGQSIERMNAEISRLMNPEQRVKFEKKLEEMRARWTNRKWDGHSSRSSHFHSRSKSETPKTATESSETSPSVPEPSTKEPAEEVPGTKP